MTNQTAPCTKNAEVKITFFNNDGRPAEVFGFCEEHLDHESDLHGHFHSEYIEPLRCTAEVKIEDPISELNAAMEEDETVPTAP